MRQYPEDRSIAATLLEPDETIVHMGPATPTMQRAGIVSVAWAVPVLAIGWLLLRKVSAHLGEAGSGQLTWPFFVFSAFGLLWVAIAARLLWEPWRLHRLYPHVFHLLTDRRFLMVDRRSGPIHAIALGDIRQMKTFSPFGRLSV